MSEDKVTNTHERKVGRLWLTMKLTDGELTGLSLSRSGDQRDEGAGHIDIDNAETLGLADFLSRWLPMPK